MDLVTLERDSEPYSARGNVASAGVQNQLGRPHMDPLAVFVREAVQNCWDAHLPEDPHIRVEIGVRTLSTDELDHLRRTIFSDPAPESGLAPRLASAAEGGKPLRVMWIADRNTSGLGGPTRADRVSQNGDVPHDFVDLLRNVGQPPDKAHGGGTFGFGKAALFKASRVSTLVVHTRCRTADGDLESRLIAVGLGPQFTAADRDGNNRRYTGRHWWGVRAADGMVDPLLGVEADRLAHAVGLPALPEGESGTTIGMLAPVFPSGRSPETAMEQVVQTLLWNFWPKMRPSPTGRPAIEFAVTCEGSPVEVPDPSTVAPLSAFCRALENLDAFRIGERRDPLGNVHEITYRRQRIGLLSLYRSHRTEAERRLFVDPELPLGGIVEPYASHVALMRTPRLIVSYRRYQPLQSDSFEYAGVFLADDAFDRAFAASEPPTHDDWVIEQMSDATQRGAVRMALRRIARRANDFADPSATAVGPGRAEGLGPLAARLGGLLVGLSPRSASRRPKVRKRGPRVRGQSDEERQKTGEPTGQRVGGASGGDAGPSRLAPGRPGIRVLAGALEVVDGRGAVATCFKLKHGVRSDGSRLSAVATVVLDDGRREKAPPDGAPVPETLGWRTPAGEWLAGETIEANLDQAGEWTVYVSLPDDSMIQVSVAAEPIAASPPGGCS